MQKQSPHARRPGSLRRSLSIARVTLRKVDLPTVDVREIILWPLTDTEFHTD
jgi:hypothetical protein